MSEKPPKTPASEEIDENLRRAYQQILDEDVPERFRDLLDRLKSDGTPPKEGQ